MPACAPSCVHVRLCMSACAAGIGSRGLLSILSNRGLEVLVSVCVWVCASMLVSGAAFLCQSLCVCLCQCVLEAE